MNEYGRTVFGRTGGLKDDDNLRCNGRGLVKIGGVWVGGSGMVTVGEGLPGLECERKLGWNGRGAGENGNKCSSRRIFCEMKTFVLIANLSNCGYIIY
jgi:hypothetical protein